MNHSQSLYISVYFYAIRIAKAEEMAQQLRAQEAPGSVPTPTWWLTAIHKYSSRGASAFLGASQH